MRLSSGFARVRSGAFFLSLCLLVACGGGGSAAPGGNSNPAPAALLSIAITPHDAALPKGSRQQLKATGTYSDGTTKDVSDSASWSSSSAANVTIGNTAGSRGMIQSVAVGQSTVSASLAAGASGAMVIGQTVVSVQPAALVSVALNPASTSVALGLRQQFTLTGTYTDGSNGDLTATASWISSDPTVATVSGGQIMGLKQGSSTITAGSGSFSASSALTISPAVLVSIAVAPQNVAIPKGTTRQFTATGTYSDGSSQSLTSSVSWTASSGAAITAGGLATGTSTGTVNIGAHSGAVSGNASAIVVAGSLVSISVSPSSTSISKGLTQQFSAVGTYSDGSTLDMTNAVNWSTSSGASITSQGLATGTAVASVTVTAQSSSVKGTADLSVTAASLVSLGVNPALATVARSASQQFSAIGTYTDGSTRDVTASVSWSATPGAAISTAGLATAITIGTVTITATSAGISDTGSLGIIKPALSSITIQPASVTLGIGAHQQYTATATYADNVQEDVTASALWHSSNSSVVSLAGSGLASVVGTNSATISITASSGIVTSNTASLTASAGLPRVCDSPILDLKLLVITNGRSEADFAAISQILDYVGTPYTVFDIATQPGGITSGLLSDGSAMASTRV